MYDELRGAAARSGANTKCPLWVESGPSLFRLRHWGTLKPVTQKRRRGESYCRESGRLELGANEKVIVTVGQ